MVEPWSIGSLSHQCDVQILGIYIDRLKSILGNPFSTSQYRGTPLRVLNPSQVALQFKTIHVFIDGGTFHFLCPWTDPSVFWRWLVSGVGSEIPRTQQQAVLDTLVTSTRNPPDPKPCFQNLPKIWFPYGFHEFPCDIRSISSADHALLGLWDHLHGSTPCLFDTALNQGFDAMNLRTSLQISYICLTDHARKCCSNSKVVTSAMISTGLLASAFVTRCHKWVSTSHWSGQKIPFGVSWCCLMVFKMPVVLHKAMAEVSNTRH